MPDEAFDLRLAAPFVVLAEELHFGRAADRLGTKQPVLSQQLARLERQLGARLVARGGGHVTLTPAGARFLVEVREMLVQVGLAEAALRSDGAGELRLHLGAGMHPTIGDIVGSFVAAHPEIAVFPVTGTPTAAVRAVRAGEADVGFGLPEDARPDLHYAPVARGPLGVATAVGHPIAGRGRASWTDLEGEPAVVGPPGVSDASNRLVRTTLLRTGVRVHEVISAGVPRATYLQHSIATGAVVLVTPSWTVDPPPPGVTWTVLEPEQLLELGVVWDDRAAGELVRRFVAWARARSPIGSPAAVDACEA